MPVANYEQYCEMLEKAREGRYAYPAINVTSTSTANAAIKAFADAKSALLAYVFSTSFAFSLIDLGTQSWALSSSNIAPLTLNSA